MAAPVSHLLFVPKSTGYELHERVGEPPAPGSKLELDDNRRFVVSKVGPSPLPRDPRPCVFLQAAG